MILNRAKDYYENDKKRLKKQARDKYRNLSEEEKNKKREYGRNKYHNMSKEKKQKLKEYQKIYRKTKKKKKIDIFSFLCIKNGTRSFLFRRKWHH